MFKTLPKNKLILALAACIITLMLAAPVSANDEAAPAQDDQTVVETAAPAEEPVPAEDPANDDAAKDEDAAPAEEPVPAEDPATK